MKQPKVSVIVPVYNVESYLEQCLDSICNQTLKEIEIICIDDGSTDHSLEILNRYQQKDMRVQVYSQSNAGAGAARNHGISVARGQFFSFLDSDDFFEPDMLQKAYEEAVSRNAQIVVFRSDQFHEDTNQFVQVSWTLREKALPPYQPIYHRNFTDNVFKVFVGWAWDKLFEREFILNNQLFFQEQRTSNDMLFVFSALVLADRIAIVDQVLAHQRRNNLSSLSNTREKSWDCFYKALQALKQHLEQYGLYWELEQDFINYALHFSLWNVETIQGSKKKILYDKLKTEWFSELGIDDKPKKYFYNQAEYKKYCYMKKHTYKEYFNQG